MKKWQLMIVSIVTMLVVTACGTSEQSTSDDKATNGSAPVQPKETAKPEEKKEEEAAEPKEAAIRLMDQLIKYQHEGAAHEESGFLTHSSNQGFSLYLFEGFTLEAEEPGRDMVLFDADSNVSMRVEMLGADTDWNLVEQSSTEQLKAVNNNIEKNMWEDKFEKFDGATTLKADNGKETVYVLLVKGSEEHPSMKLTIHVPTDSEVVSKLVSMAKTIQVESAH